AARQRGGHDRQGPGAHRAGNRQSHVASAQFGRGQDQQDSRQAGPDDSAGNAAGDAGRHGSGRKGCGRKTGCRGGEGDEGKRREEAGDGGQESGVRGQESAAERNGATGTGENGGKSKVKRPKSKTGRRSSLKPQSSSPSARADARWRRS